MRPVSRMPGRGPPSVHLVNWPWPVWDTGEGLYEFAPVRAGNAISLGSILYII